MTSWNVRALGMAALFMAVLVVPSGAEASAVDTSGATAAQPTDSGAVAATAADPTATTSRRRHKHPLRRVALGVSMTAVGGLATAQAFTASVGRAPAIWSIWNDWGGPNNAFPDAGLLDGLRAQGSVPMIIWQPVDSAHLNNPSYRYSRIASGAFDKYIRQWARDAKAWGGTVILRFAPEMDGYWFPWGMGRFTNTPARFVAAWRHIYNIFRGRHGVGARNVKFLWSPLRPCTCKKSLFPGNRYVDYVGMSAYNWPTRTRPKMSMLQAYTKKAHQLMKLSKKPIIVAETGTTGRGKDRATWIRNGYPAVYKALPRIKAIVYFNMDVRSDGQPDWRLTEAAGTLAAYRKIVADKRFQGSVK